MTPICITGADAPALHHLAQALQGAGVAPAQPLQRDAALDLHVWHQRVCQSGALPVVPSRLWEQVAIDLLLSNIDQPVWSWANARSIDALDFWAQLDTNIRFVLLCQTPQQAVAELFAANTGTEADEAHQLALWQQRHQALLRFHLRHPERSVLVWADQARQAPHVLAAHVAQQWQLPLQPDAVIATAQPLPHNAVQLQLAAQLVARHPQHQQKPTRHKATPLPRPRNCWCSTTCNWPTAAPNKPRCSKSNRKPTTCCKNCTACRSCWPSSWSSTRPNKRPRAKPSTSAT